jgi:predicted acylesterase/phospholipase RssA
VRASSAAPLFFQPKKINDDFYIDGGIADRPGIRGLLNSRHIIVQHYLHSRGLASWIEDKLLYSKIHTDPFCFKHQSRGKMGPNKLNRGPQVIAEFREKTHEWLDQKILV